MSIDLGPGMMPFVGTEAERKELVETLSKPCTLFGLPVFDENGKPLELKR